MIAMHQMELQEAITNKRVGKDLPCSLQKVFLSPSAQLDFCAGILAAILAHAVVLLDKLWSSTQLSLSPAYRSAAR